MATTFEDLAKRMSQAKNTLSGSARRTASGIGASNLPNYNPSSAQDGFTTLPNYTPGSASVTNFTGRQKQTSLTNSYVPASEVTGGTVMSQSGSKARSPYQPQNTASFAQTTQTSAPVQATAPAASGSRVTPATVYNPAGNASTGYVINGLTYTDPQGTNRIPVGSTVVLNDGRIYTLGANGGYQNNSASRTSYTYNGKSYPGYIIGGKTYTDPLGRNPVPNGALVQTGGGEYMATPMGGVPTTSNLLNSYRTGTDRWMDYWMDSGNARADAIDAATQIAVNRANDQRPEIERQAEEAARNAYIAYVTASNPYGVNAQRTDAIGLANSGYSETSMAQLGSAYQQALAENEQSKLAALRQLDAEIRDALLTGDMEKANALADLQAQIAQQGIANENNILNAGMQALQLGYGAYENDRNYNRGVYESDRDYNRGVYESDRDFQFTSDQVKWDQAATLLQLGFSSEDIANQLGIPLADVKAYAQLIRAGMMPTSRSSGGSRSSSGRSGSGSSRSSSGSSGSGSSGDYSYENLYKNMAASGDPEAYLAANWRNYGIAYSMLDSVMEGYNNWVNSSGTNKNEDAEIVNQHGENWIHVPGLGRLSRQEFDELFENGEIIESFVDGKYIYTKA